MLDYTHDDWTSRAAALTFRDKAFIGGRFVDAASGETFDCINPATGEVLAQVASCDEEDVNRAVTAARNAFEAGSWSRAAPGERKAVLLKLADLIRENLEEMALLDSLDMGKLVTDAATVDAPGSAHFFQWYAEAIDKIYDEVAPTGHGDLALVRRVPLGVVGAVTPWNFPLDMATWKSAAALAAGNSVVLKPAEQSPLSALRLAELAYQLKKEQILKTGGPEAFKAFTQSELAKEPGRPAFKVHCLLQPLLGHDPRCVLRRPAGPLSLPAGQVDRAHPVQAGLHRHGAGLPHRVHDAGDQRVGGAGRLAGAVRVGHQSHREWTLRPTVPAQAR